jgi:hypothetical protein
MKSGVATHRRLEVCIILLFATRLFVAGNYLWLPLFAERIRFAETMSLQVIRLHLLSFSSFCLPNRLFW